MKILHISDTHGRHNNLTDLPEADILVHSGDFCFSGSDNEVLDFLNWFIELPYKHTILIAGNHDAGMSNYKDVFDEVYAGALIVGEKLILSHEPVDVPWAFNIHGHVHSGEPMSDDRHFNVCGEARKCYEPVNLNQFMKAGFMAKIQTIHRDTIDKATKRARKRGKKLGQKK